MEGDDKKYVQQMHVITYEGSGGDFDDFTLISGEEDDPYLLTSLLPNSEGSITLNGAIKRLFEAQWIVNHSEKQIKDSLDLSSKTFYQTDDGNLLHQNILNDLKTGDIFLHAPNSPLTEVSTSADITGMQSNKNDWQAQGMSANGINEAMVQAPKSGTAWRQTEAVLSEAHSLFELFIENKGLAIEEMLERFVRPHHRKKLNNKKAISEILEEHQIKFIDSRYVPNQAIRRVNEVKKKTILSGEIYEPSIEDIQTKTQEELLQSVQNKNGDQRFIKVSEIEDKTWKDIFKDSESKLIVDTTGENKNIQAVMATYNTALNFMASLQGREMTAPEKLIFNRIIETADGISPVELGQAQKEKVPAPPVPAGRSAKVPEIAVQPAP